MKQDIVRRGQTASGGTETLEFSGIQIENKNMAYTITEFVLYPASPEGSENLFGSITAGKTALDPTVPNFNNESLIATAMKAYNTGSQDGSIESNIVNDTFLITQNLLLMVMSPVTSEPVNWQCRFKAVKMTDAEMAANNFKQYMISDGS